jgi:hypothetical protein
MIKGRIGGATVLRAISATGVGVVVKIGAQQDSLRKIGGVMNAVCSMSHQQGLVKPCSGK